MRVLQINSVCGIGSTGRIATDIHNILIEQGHESYIGYGKKISQNCDTSIKIGDNVDVYLHAILTRLLDKHGFASIKATKQFIQKIDKINPDVIHLHNIHGYYINIEELFNYLKSANKRVVWTLHDCWAFTGHCAHFDYIACEKWKTGCYDCPQKSEYPKSIFIDNSKNNYLRKKSSFLGVRDLTIVTPSNWLANLVRESFLKEYPVEVINNGVDLRVFKSTNSNFREKNNLQESFVILGVANIWNEKKGLDTLIRISNMLDESMKIVIVGLTQKQKERLPRNILGITKTADIKELVNIYTAADVFVNPTLEDNFPTTNLESLACGTPVITFKTGGSIESIDETTGFLVEKGNITELINKINKIQQNGKQRYYYSCINKANRLFSKNDRYLDYLKIYCAGNAQFC
jgi:putative colanic acid biosynthesis glycosyltransferase